MRALCDAVLRAGLDDWVPLAAIEGFARQLGAKEESDVIDLSLRAVRELARGGLVVLGDVSDEGFFEWSGPLDESLVRIERAWRTLDELERGFACWLRNTPRGDQRAQTVANSGG
jgi:hypothetical protein